MSPGTAARAHRTSGTGPRHRDSWPNSRAFGAKRGLPGELVDTVGPRTRARPSRDSWSSPQDLRHGPECPRTAGRARRTSSTARVTWDSWSTPRALRPLSEWPGKSGRRGRHWNPGLGRPGHRTGPRFPGQLVDSAAPRIQSRVARECWSTPRALGHWPQSPEISGVPRGASEPGASRPGQLDNPAGHRTRGRVTR